MEEITANVLQYSGMTMIRAGGMKESSGGVKLYI
jgi:hypothetical protein